MPVTNGGGGGDLRVTVRQEGIQNRTIQSLVDVEYANGDPTYNNIVGNQT